MQAGSNSPTAPLDTPLFGFGNPATRGCRGLVPLIRRGLALGFTLCFMSFALYLCVASAIHFVTVFSNTGHPMETLIKAINLGVVGIAIFELSVNIHQEYVLDDHASEFYQLLRRSLSRFIGVVCVALALEGLMMTIKYSQLDLAGNLYYPVAVVLCTAALLLSLGIFLRLTEPRAAEAA